MTILMTILPRDKSIYDFPLSPDFRPFNDHPVHPYKPDDHFHKYPNHCADYPKTIRKTILRILMTILYILTIIMTSQDHIWVIGTRTGKKLTKCHFFFCTPGLDMYLLRPGVQRYAYTNWDKECKKLISLNIWDLRQIIFA